MTSLRLAVERWADEVAGARSTGDRASVRSALGKLSSITPSAMAGYGLDALDGHHNTRPLYEWGWSIAATGRVPLVLGLAISLVIHISRIIAMAAGG